LDHGGRREGGSKSAKNGYFGLFQAAFPENGEIQNFLIFFFGFSTPKLGKKSLLGSQAFSVN